jgi:hypothetical protein
MMDAFIEFLKNPDIYNGLINYIHEGVKAAPPNLGIAEFLFIFSVDLLFSLGCMYLAMLCLRIRANVKQYAWFLFIWNSGWFIFLLGFRGIWEALDYLVIRLDPGLLGVIADNFSISLIFAAVLVYIWLLARTFSLGFFGASGLFFLSQLFYFAVIFTLFLFLPLQEGGFLKSAQETLGLKPAINSYLADVVKILSRQNVLLLIKIKPYHL